MAANPGLAAGFYEARGTAVEGTHDALDVALVRFWERGRAAWPEVALEASVLARYLGERAPAQAPAAAWVEGLDASDMFLACACAEGAPIAVQAFARAFLGKLGTFLRKLDPTPEFVVETEQVLLEKLFVGTGGEQPRIRQFGGQGSLGGWVRVAAVRTALHILEAERAARPRADEAEAIAGAILPAGDPELDLVRSTYREGSSPRSAPRSPGCRAATGLFSASPS